MICVSIAYLFGGLYQVYFNSSRHHKLVHSLSKFLFLADNYQNKLFDPEYTNVRIGELCIVDGLDQK